jgi:uncharacterized Zn ribbon protein
VKKRLPEELSNAKNGTKSFRNIKIFEKTRNIKERIDGLFSR